MSRDLQTNSINTLDPILKAALKSLDLQPEMEVERYERFKNIIGSLVNTENGPDTNPKTRVLAKKQSDSPIQLPNFGNKVVNNSQGDSIKEQILSLVYQPSGAQSNLELGPEEKIPDNYLASSENLLRSLEAKQFEKNSPQSLKQIKENLLTPFGVGSFLMLFSVVGLLFGYLGWNQLLNAESVSTVGKTKENIPVQNDSLGPVNLDLGTISTLKPNSNPFISSPAPRQTGNSAKSTNKPANSIEITRGGADLASALLPPSLRFQSPRTVSNPAINSSILSTSAPSISPVPVPVPPPSSSPSKPKKESINQAKFFGDYYYVLVFNTDGKSLNQARKVVNDAYLVQFPQGVRIQMGAFDNQKEAQELVQRLEQQGVKAEIYRSQS
jgi:hypothetical protein